MRLLLFCLVFFLSNAAASEGAIQRTAREIGMSEQDLREYMTDCDRNQTSMNICAQFAFVEQDLQLMDVVRQLAAVSNGRNAKLLASAQRAWLAYRDKDCEYEASDVVGGSLWAAVDLYCKRDRTRERIEHLRVLLSCTSTHGKCRSPSKPAK